MYFSCLSAEFGQLMGSCTAEEEGSYVPPEWQMCPIDEQAKGGRVPAPFCRLKTAS